MITVKLYIIVKVYFQIVLSEKLLSKRNIIFSMSYNRFIVQEQPISSYRFSCL